MLQFAKRGRFGSQRSALRGFHPCSRAFAAPSLNGEFGQVGVIWRQRPGRRRYHPAAVLPPAFKTMGEAVPCRANAACHVAGKAIHMPANISAPPIFTHVCQTAYR